MKFTGERYIPNDPECEEIKYEHESRYLFASGFVDGKIVGDIGCGTGYGCEMLSKNNAVSVVGVDISFDTLVYSMAHFKNGSVSFINSPSENLPFQGRKFDIVTSFEVIEHLENYRGHLSEIKRILKDDGILIISTPNVVNQLHRKNNKEQEFHVHEFCYRDFEKLLSEYFESIRFFSQKYTQSIVLEPFDGDKLPGEKEDDVEIEINRTFISDSPSEFDGDYMIAICGDKWGPDDEIAAKCRIYNISQTSRIHEMRGHITNLDEEIKKLGKLADDRAQWAKDLDKELGEKSAIIKSLKEELEKSNAWAIRVSEELKELREKEQQVGFLRKILKKFI